MKINKLELLKSIAIPLLVGILASVLTGGGMETFQSLNKPALSPPGWFFPIVWTILYVLMGIAFYLIMQSGKDDEDVNRAAFLYGAQLIVNFFWPIIFFGLEWYGIAFLWLVLLWILILLTIIQFNKISKTASYLMIPYLIWVTFAGYLNLAIWLLNFHF